ncbi:hypothetical protein [Streptomyces nojiriensis]|uniref:hypothetical protein n=1 Tax=Streptomyces nojiriensis TaxID=66374 RepID=UPI0035DA8946
MALTVVDQVEPRRPATARAALLAVTRLVGLVRDGAADQAPRDPQGHRQARKILVDKEQAYGRSREHDQRALKALTRIWGYAPFLLAHDRLVMPPWEDPAAVMSDFLGTKDTPADGENNIPIVHPAVMSPLLVYALRMVLELGPDILAAWNERRRLLDRSREASPRGDSHVVVDYLKGLIAEGRPLPGFSGIQGARSRRASGPAAAKGLCPRLTASTSPEPSGSTPIK